MMSRRYKILLPLTVHTEDAAYEQGDEFEKDFTAVEEAENLASGLLELQPMTYKVVGESRVHETNPGDTFEMALPLGQEELLVEGGQIERVDDKKKPAPADKKPAATTKKKEAN
jgi:hypothetical protein